MAERLRRSAGEIRYGDERRPLSLSVGVASFRAGRGDRLRALEDYRALVDTGALAHSDLRQAVAMIAAVAGADPAAQTSAAPERCDLLDSLVGRPSWRSEPAAVRMEDLRQLAASTHVCPPAERPARLQALVARFADLPAERPENGTPPENPPLWYGLGIWCVLSAYWVAPWINVSREVQPPPWYYGLAVAVYAFGVFFHFASDMQKHAHIQARTGTLLQTGLWARCRNPNYFGELLIYSGFCMLAMHWAPFVVLGGIVCGMWIPNMIRKDRSLSRYPEFAAWRKRSGLFVPYLL